MSWSDRRNGAGVARTIAVLALAGTLAGCFQPLYGDRAPDGGMPCRDLGQAQTSMAQEEVGLPGRPVAGEEVVILGPAVDDHGAWFQGHVSPLPRTDRGGRAPG